MKRICIMLTLALTLSLFSGCGHAGRLSDREIDAIDGEETFPDGPYELAEVFRSVDELYAAADLVIVGTVSGQTCIDPDGLPQTVSRVDVERVLHGDCPEPGTVDVTEEGGTTSRGQVLYVGVPFMTDGQQYLLFLTGADEEGRRFVVGAFQGKFIVREGYVFQQAADHVKLSRDVYTPVPLDRFPTPDHE